MREAINDGGPAFPVPAMGHDEDFNGMSLRDHFAGLALSSGEASSWRDNQYQPADGLSIIENTARCAYQFADAMIRARNGGAA